MIKTKQKSLSTLTGELDDLISKFVRLSAADDDGICQCISCPEGWFWTQMDCAHYKDRDHMGTRFYLPNLAPACKNCNRFNPVNHLNKWEEKMTTEQRFDLEKRSRSLMKWTKPELEDLIDLYTDKVKELRKQKSL